MANNFEGVPKINIETVMKLVLASESKNRVALLQRLGVPFTCRPHGLDEQAIVHGVSPPRQITTTLAEEKAASVARHEDGAVIIGSDQVVVLEDQIIGKPGSRDRAIEQLSQMSGKTHDVITAVAVSHEGRVHRHVETAQVTLRRLSQAELRRYVDHDQPIDCAGSYRIGAMGITLVERIVVEDFTAISGLPLIYVTTVLREIGFPIP